MTNNAPGGWRDIEHLPVLAPVMACDHPSGRSARTATSCASRIGPTVAKRLTRLSPTDVRIVLRAKEAEGLSAATVKQIHAILRAALQHAVREDLVARNVAKLVVMTRARSAEGSP